MKDIYNAGIKLLEDQIKLRNTIRDQSKKACGDLLNTHCLSCGIIYKLYEKFLDVIGKTNYSISTRIPLISSFIQGIDLCEISIMEALYTQAATLLKQELETVAAINESVKGKRKDRKTPNVQFVKFGLNEEYSFLNGIGHVSDKQIFEELFKPLSASPSGTKQPASITPLYNEELCVKFYTIHILLIIQIIEHLCDLFNDMYDYNISNDLQEALQIIYSVLIKEKCLIES